MRDFADSVLFGEFARAFAQDLGKAPAGRFPCCPVCAGTKENGAVIGRFIGDIGLPRIQEFKDSLCSLAVENLEKVILDLKEVTLTRTAVGVLVDFAASIHGRNKKLYLYRPSGQVRGLLKELELLPFFTCLETEDDVLTRLHV